MARESATPLWRNRVVFVGIALMTVFALILTSCTSGDDSSYAGIIEERGFTDDDVTAALKTYKPSGEFDDYLIFASGGHSGQMHVIGVPSMRLLKTIGVFTPEPWQGWGYGNEVTDEVLDQGNIDGREVRWGDTHHPALSETAGEYDGEFVFINDKANARIAVIDLRDFETKQIIKNPVAIVDHGGAMVTPDSEWVIEGGQYATPNGWEYAPISEYESEYKGMVTFWKFDRDAGRIDPDASFAMELPPYWQDICDAGKLVSEGWVFCNSFNTEMATGDPLDKSGEPFEAGASARENDYMHVINLEAAAAIAASGGTIDVNGFDVIPLQTSIDEGLLYFIPEPKSPHGVDVAPKGDYLVVSGKLDPHVSVYSFEKIQQAIADKNWVPDPFGVPVLDFDATLEAQVEVGLGPLHTQFDDKGYAYTSLFLDSAVARWSLGPPYRDAFQLDGTIGVHYNIGHLMTAEGDTVSPDGDWLVALNKWSIDRFYPPGPLLPQNFQLIDISEEADTNEDGGMQLLYDMPIGFGEPHYAQMIKADKLDPFEVYPEIGWDPGTMAVDPNAPQAGQEDIVRNGDTVEIWMTLVRSHYTPDRVEVKAGDHVIWHLTNIDTSLDATHGFAIPGYNINVSLEPGETATVEFDADASGVYPFYCSEFCSALHLEMAGYFLVEPGE